MKKRHPIRPLIALFLCAVLFLPGCARPESADSLAYRLLNLYPFLPPCSQYIKTDDADSPGYLSAEDFFYLYTGEKIRLPEWERLAEFRLILSDSPTFFEIHILKALSASDADELAELLARRAALLTRYNHGEKHYPAKDPFVFRRGCFAVLVATDDNEAALRLLKRIL